MSWNLEYLPEAEKYLKSLAGSQRTLVLKAIKKFSRILCPLMNKATVSPSTITVEPILPDCSKSSCVQRACGLFANFARTESSMMIIVIGVRADEEVYDLAQKRASKHGLIG